MTIRIVLRVARDGDVYLSADTAGAPVLDPFARMSAQKATQIRTTLKGEFSALKERFDLDEMPWADIQAALNTMREVGAGIGSQFFGGGDEFAQVAEFFRAVVPHWSVNDGSDVILQFESPLEYIFPVEILPVFDYSRPWPVTDFTSLVDAVRRFLGFGSMTYRSVSTHFNPGSVSPSGSVVRIIQFRDASLPGAAKEYERFADLAGVIADVPFPNALEEGSDVARSLARAFLIDDDGYPVQSGPDSVPRILHFSCHSETGFENSEDYVLRLQGVVGGPREVSIDELRQKIAVMIGDPSAGRFLKRRPLIVMNSCGSSSMDPETSRSFPSLFLDQRALGFIGSETVVPDAVAAEMGAHFYRHVSQGSNVGQALLAAKWTLLARRLNPLGLLWTSYTDPDYQPVSHAP